MSQAEAEVLADQLDELLAEPIVDADDALEVAMVAGLLARLDPASEALASAVKWRTEGGDSLLEEAFLMIELEPLAEAVDELTPDDSDEAVEEAVLDVDELIAAAIWSEQTAAVGVLARAVNRSVRATPEVFASLSDVGADLAKHPVVAEYLDLYGFWLEIADAAQWADN